MNRRAKWAAPVVVLMLILSGMAYAADETVQTSSQEDSGDAVDAGNQICPVTGDPVDGVNFYTYKGKRYGLCCPICVSAFRNDPEKYSAIADKEVAGDK